MGKLDNIGYYDKRTNRPVSEEEFTSISKEYRRINAKRLFNLLENDPQSLILEEIETLRSIMNKKKKKVELKYDGGFYMTADEEFNCAKNLSVETNGILRIVGYMMNKSGVVQYGKNVDVKSFVQLRKIIGVSDRIWRRVKKEIDEKNILRKETIKGKIMILVNPKYSGRSYEVTELKFIAFQDHFKEFLEKIDYLYLTKKYEREY